jgi:hypothetical protein
MIVCTVNANVYFCAHVYYSKFRVFDSLSRFLSFLTFRYCLLLLFTFSTQFRFKRSSEVPEEKQPQGILI